MSLRGEGEEGGDITVLHTVFQTVILVENREREREISLRETVCERGGKEEEEEEEEIDKLSNFNHGIQYFLDLAKEDYTEGIIGIPFLLELWNFPPQFFDPNSLTKRGM